MTKTVQFERIRGKLVHRPSFAHGRITAVQDLPSLQFEKEERHVLKAAERWESANRAPETHARIARRAGAFDSLMYSVRAYLKAKAAK
jgi:hypothetical protein